MDILTKTELINDPVVRQEIERYKWIESEKLGADIGYERAAKEWVARCSKEWIKHRGVAAKKPARKAKQI